MNRPSDFVMMLACPTSTIKRLGEAAARKVQHKLDAPKKQAAAEEKRSRRAQKRLRQVQAA